MNERFRGRIGTEVLQDDLVSSVPVRRLAATLDRQVCAVQGAEIPQLWHWLYCQPACLTNELGSDGLPVDNELLPSVEKTRRMWAGTRIQFIHPIRVGEALLRRSIVANISEKEGRSGPLVFVTIRHEIVAGDRLALIEEQDIAYCCLPWLSRASAKVATGKSLWRRRVEASTSLLFRYSALTFNCHRVHFDNRYAEGEEGYPGLVVQGPLIATLMFELVREVGPNALVRKCAFRATRPLCITGPFFLCGRPDGERTLRIWAEDAAGAITTHAVVEF